DQKDAAFNCIKSKLDGLKQQKQKDWGPPFQQPPILSGKYVFGGTIGQASKFGPGTITNWSHTVFMKQALTLMLLFLPCCPIYLILFH
uniref:Uncharacterized protein n=1 Tax=Fundulus heteroclitus TaxID=8078 RepID=A0A3Q2QMP3_FUNHE